MRCTLPAGVNVNNGTSVAAAAAAAAADADDDNDDADADDPGMLLAVTALKLPERRGVDENEEGDMGGIPLPLLPNPVEADAAEATPERRRCTDQTLTMRSGRSAAVARMCGTSGCHANDATGPPWAVQRAMSSHCPC